MSCHRDYWFAGYKCQEHNNPADFFLDVINGDSTALQNNKQEHDEGDEEMGTVLQGADVSVAGKLVEAYEKSEMCQNSGKELKKIHENKNGRSTRFSSLVIKKLKFCCMFIIVLL